MERIGLAFEAGLRPKEVVECVQYAEELGYDSAWVTEGHLGDQFTILTACAVATQRISLGTAVSSIFVRSAPTIAMASACVDEYSGGRMVLGLGSSHKMQVEGEYGVAYDQPIPRLLEYIDIIRGLLQEGEISYRGNIYDIEEFRMWFKPLRREIPIYLGAVNPKMLALCGQIADGVLLVQSNLEQTRAAVEQVEAGAIQAGRQVEEIEKVVLMPCSISENKAEARDRGRGRFAMYAARFPRYRQKMVEAGFSDEVEKIRQAWAEGDQPRALQIVPDALIDSWQVAGTPEECRNQIQTYRDIGVTLPVVSPAMDGERAKEQAMEVIRACAPR